MNKFGLFLLLFLLTGATMQAQTALDKGNAAYGARNYKDAAFHFGRAVMDNPGDLALQIKLANCYRFLNKMNESEKRYAIVCNNSSTEAINYFNYGLVLQANRKYKEALEQFKKYGMYDKARAEQARKACLFAQQQTAAQSAFTVAKETNINHLAFDDYAPVLHNNKLLFTSARKISIGNGVSADENNYLYETTRGSDGKLSNLKLVKSPVEFASQTNLSPLAINSSENMAATTFNQFTNGVRHIYEAALVNTGMELVMPKHGMKDISYIPTGDPFPHIGERNSASFPCFANDGQAIYFAAYNLPGGYGGFDLWVIYKQGNDWTKPQNLGPNVNTQGDEVSPMVATNGQLFFASDYHKGFGGMDVFRATNQGGVWKEVRNLGNQVNSSFDDMYFAYDAVKRMGYFSSNRDGYYNIYNARLTGAETLLPLVNESERAVAVVDPVTAPNGNDNGAANTNGTATNNGANTNETNTYYNNGSTSNNNGNTTNNNEYVYNNPNNNYTNNNNNSSPYVTPNTNGAVTNKQGAIQRTSSGGYRPVASQPTNYNYQPPNGATTNNDGLASRAVSDKPTINPDAPNMVPCAMNFYIGAILDKETQRPVKGANIYIRNTKTNEEKRIKEPTNHYGEYSVILEPLHDYTIAVSKSGYRNLVFDVSTGSGGKKTLLGTRQMTASPTVERDLYGAAVEEGDPTVTVDKPTTEELINPVRPTGKTFSYEANGMPMPEEGYLIQAIVTNKLSQEQIDYLGQYGNVITENRGKDKAYRVGIFASPIHTDQALASIKQKYPDAFKVPVELDNKQLGNRLALSSQVIYPLPPPKPATMVMPTEQPSSNPPASTATATPPPPIKEKPVNNWTNNNATFDAQPNSAPLGNERIKDEVAFKVQLGAFKDAKSINFSQLEGMGYIEQQKKANGLTYVYLSSFKTIEDARAARTKVKERGVVAPFIVAFKNGVQVNINEVLN